MKVNRDSKVLKAKPTLAILRSQLIEFLLGKRGDLAEVRPDLVVSELVIDHLAGSKTVMGETGFF
jgi:hypothetical protein